MRVVVAGAGVFGCSIALTLARAGVQVTIADPAPFGANASGVAAGMLAPVFETLFDERPDRFARLLAARGAWPAFAASTGVPIERPGAIAVTRDEATLERWAGSLGDLGVAFTARTPAEMARARPDLADGVFGLAIEDDWRLDPLHALRALLDAAFAAGAELRRARVVGFTPGLATLHDGQALTADALVVATGAGTELIQAAPELAALTPIKGHLLDVAGAGFGPEVVRFDGGYICPTSTGCLVGATMETGRFDTVVDAAQVARLRSAVGRYAPSLIGVPATARVGVRAGTADGLPIVGHSRAPGVWLAVGARRNGWLLAPTVARELADSLVSGPSRLASGPASGQASA